MFTSFFVSVKTGFQKIRKEKDAKYYKHDKQLDENNNPNLLAPITNVLKAADVESPDS